MKELTSQSEVYDDGVDYGVKEYANYLGRICYAKRNKMNPYYNNVVIAGYEKG